MRFPERQLKDHPNIVHLLGLCECDMVTEYFPSYMDVLLLGESDDSSEPKQELEELSIREVIRMALDAARGLQAMHEMPGGPVVHADLQPRQLLLDENGVVKINDLNRCRFMGRDAAGEPCPFKISKGNGVWRAPEEYAGEVGGSGGGDLWWLLVCAYGVNSCPLSGCFPLSTIFDPRPLDLIQLASTCRPL